MRVVITGATGNVGTSVLRSLAGEPSVSQITGIARRRPSCLFPKTEWREADVANDDLVPLLEDAGAVIHLAWVIQPSRDAAKLHEINVAGSRRVFEAVRRAGVPALVYASSIGAYSPGPKDRMVGEQWPTGGVSTSFYSRHKSEVERLLDDFERDSPSTRVVRLRKAIVVKSGAACGIRRLFMGPLLPPALVKPGRVPIMPDLRGLRLQLVHSHDAGEAYRLALVRPVTGAYNIAADPVLDLRAIAGLMKARSATASQDVGTQGCRPELADAPATDAGRVGGPGPGGSGHGLLQGSQRAGLDSGVLVRGSLA